MAAGTVRHATCLLSLKPSPSAACTRSSRSTAQRFPVRQPLHRRCRQNFGHDHRIQHVQHSGCSRGGQQSRCRQRQQTRSVPKPRRRPHAVAIHRQRRATIANPAVRRCAGHMTAEELPIAVPARLGDYVRQLRRAADASQREMAARSGVSLTALARIESGRTADVRLSTLQSLAEPSGHRVCLVNHDWTLLFPYPSNELWRDLRGRRLPAHLDVWRFAPDWFDNWWATHPHGPFRYGHERGRRDSARAEAIKGGW